MSVERPLIRDIINGTLNSRIETSQFFSGFNNFGLSAAEQSVGVTPTDYSYPPLDVRRYGVKGDGTDERAVIQSVLDVAAVTGGNVYFPVPPVAYHLGSTGTGLIPNDGVLLVGDASEEVLFTYAGNGVAFNFIGGANGLMNAYVQLTDAGAIGLQFGNDSRRSLLRRVTVQCTSSPASARTGTALSFFTTTSATTFSGNFLMEQVYLLGFKYGLSVDCFEIALKTWTTIVGSQVFILGPGAGVCAGSRGIVMTATTNGVGSVIFGGTIENCEASIQVANGGFGISYYGDIEGNTSDAPILGASYCGEIVTHPAGTVYRAGANLTINRWFYERNLSGVWDREVYSQHAFTLYNNGGNTAFFDVYRGDSRIAGGSPTLKFRIATGNSDADTAGERTYLQLGANRMTWTSAAPASGTWAKGDVSWNTGAAAGGSPGWVCTTAGSPGTWKTMANVAA